MGGVLSGRGFRRNRFRGIEGKEGLLGDRDEDWGGFV